MSTARARPSTVDELLNNLLRAITRADNMTPDCESSKIANYDHMEYLVRQAKVQLNGAIKEVSRYGCTDRQGGSY